MRYHGRVGWGNIRANGHPKSQRWRQLLCLSCKRHVLETHGTLLHGKQVDPDKLVWATSALAEGLGIRTVTRVFDTAANTVLGWLVEAADHLEACTRHFLRDVDVEQVQMDELFALLSAVKDGEISEAEAIKRLSRSPNWVWVAMDPVCKLILAVDVGDCTLAMAQRLVHQVTRVLAPRSWLCSIHSIILCCPMPACPCPCQSSSPCLGAVPPSAGSRGRRRWRRG